MCTCGYRGRKWRSDWTGALNPLSSRSIIECCILPVLLYSAESWTLNQSKTGVLPSGDGQVYLPSPQVHNQQCCSTGTQMAFHQSWCVVHQAGIFTQDNELHCFSQSKPLSMGSPLMERIFRSTPNEVLTAHTEWLPGVQLRHCNPTCAVHIEECEGWWLSGCCSSVAEHSGCTSQVSWVRFPVAAVLFTFLYFRLITSKFLFIPM